MASSFTQLHYHLVFSTKERRPVLVDGLLPDVHAYLGGIVRNLRGIPLQIGGVADHVHLLLTLKADISVAETVSKLKANSTNWLHERLGKENWYGWQIGYGAFTVSASQVNKVVDYIRNQEEHHRQLSYRDELIALLKRHGLDFDERYLLG